MEKDEIIRRVEDLSELLTSAKGNSAALERFKSGDSATLVIILSNGIPPGIAQCSECKENLPTDQFSYYQGRVGQEGYLNRSNALCHACQKSTQANRKRAFQKADIPPKPRPGSICPECNRAWYGAWHRNHSHEKGDRGKFLGWVCNICNMRFHDRRNRKREVFDENEF